MTFEEIKYKRSSAAVIFTDFFHLLLGYNKNREGWEFVGGKQHFGESIIDCAWRETREETGFEVHEEDLTYFGYMENEEFLTILFYSYADFLVTPTKYNFNEFNEWKWFPLNKLPKPLTGCGEMALYKFLER